MPANAGIQKRGRTDLRIPLDSRLRGNDAVGRQERIIGITRTAPGGGTPCEVE